MTNRKLKKKIRQAFRNATPDLPSSLAANSLLSSVAQKKGDEKTVKPIKTPIQFKFIATLAASIAVVALLIGLLPKINPFISGDDPSGTIGHSQVPTSTDPSNDNIFVNPNYTAAELQEILDNIFATPELSIPKENADIDVDVKKFEDYVYLDILISSKNPENTDVYYFLADIDTKTIHSYTEDFDWTPYLSSEYFDVPAGLDPMNGLNAPNTVLYAEFVLFDNKLCYALSLDYGDNGEFVLINAETDKVKRSWLLIGSKTALFTFALADEKIQTTVEEWDWEFAYFDGKLCYNIEASGNIDFDAIVDAVTGEVYQNSKSSGVNEEKALQIALMHANLTITDLTEHSITLKPDSIKTPYYSIEFKTADYQYEYDISVRHGIVINAERELNRNLTEDDLLSSKLSQNDAERIAAADPLVGEDSRQLGCLETEENGIPCYEIAFQDANSSQESLYQIVLTVSKQHGVVINVEISYKDVRVLEEESMSVSNISPRPKAPNGKYGMYQAIDLAIAYTGLDYSQVANFECEEFTESGYYVITFNNGSNAWGVDIDAHTGTVIRAEENGIPVDPAITPDNTDPHNTEGPPLQPTTPTEYQIDEQEALYKALGHADLEKDEIYDYRLELEKDAAIPHWDVTFYQIEYEYEYEIALDGTVLRAEREYTKPLDDILSTTYFDEEDIVWLVKNDPMIGFNVYRMSIADPGKGNPCYLITCQSAKRSDQSEYCYVIEFSKQHGVILDLEIIYTNQFVNTTYYRDAIKTGYGNISDNTAIDAALYYADLDIYDVGTAYCDEGKLDSDVYQYNAHYNVYFNYEGCRYHYYIELRTGRLLAIDILSLGGNEEIPEPEVIMSQWKNPQNAMPDIVTTEETAVELQRQQGEDFDHYVYVNKDGNNQKLLVSPVSWSVDTGNGAIYISSDKRSLFAISYQDRQPIEIYRSTDGEITAPDSFGVNMDLEKQWLIIRDGDTLVQIDLASGKSRQLVRHENIRSHYYIDPGETTVYFEIGAGLYLTGYTIDLETGELSEDFRL